MAIPCFAWQESHIAAGENRGLLFGASQIIVLTKARLLKHDLPVHSYRWNLPPTSTPQDYLQESLEFLQARDPEEV